MNAPDYQRLFYWPGEFSYFLSSYFMGIYNAHHAVSLHDGTRWISFIPLDVKEKTLQDGLEIYSSKERYQALVSGLIDGYPLLVEKFKHALTLPDLTKAVVRAVINAALRHYAFYSQTEFTYTDLAYEKRNEYPVIEQNFHTFEDVKLKGREFLNAVALQPGSYLEQLLEKISSQLDVSVSTLKRYSIDEIYSLFDNVRVKGQEIEERDRYFMIGEGGFFTSLAGDAAASRIREFLNKTQLESELKGQVASRGYVIGRARVMTVSIHEIKSMQSQIDAMVQGEILVAETTAPEIVLACKKASAIVTNQGGMMSHAAIVSREMGIPCVVGTGNATDIIKTGDEVEVDANTGVIRVLLSHE